eukprot:5320697-Amphidinium_carterae.2
MPPGGLSSGADDIPSSSIPMNSSPKKRQRRFIMEPSRSPAVKITTPSKPKPEIMAPPPLRRCCTKRPAPAAYHWAKHHYRPA